MLFPSDSYSTPDGSVNDSDGITDGSVIDSDSITDGSVIDSDRFTDGAVNDSGCITDGAVNDSCTNGCVTIYNTESDYRGSAVQSTTATIGTSSEINKGEASAKGK